MPDGANTLKLTRLGVDTYRSAVIYMRHDCLICQSEGFEAQAQVRVHLGRRSVIATLNMVSSDILKPGQASLSEYAWRILDAREGDEVSVAHAPPLDSLRAIQNKLAGKVFSSPELEDIVTDITHGHYADIHISAFLAACAGGRLDETEIKALTQAMIKAGDTLTWPADLVVDKHCVGGLPGNRTSLIIVPIVAAHGLLIPKTSSRAITSPAGTADTMEVLAPVRLDLPKMRAVVEREGGCIVWGGAASLSPADDIMIRVERALGLDAEGQLIASVLSKKIAAGSTHAVIDVPVGPTAKIQQRKQARHLQQLLEGIGGALGIKIKTLITDGTQPVGTGIGPALEATEVLAVLQNQTQAPQDLRERALMLAGHVLEFSPDVAPGAGYTLAQDILDSGRAWTKFQAICEAQGGLHQPAAASYTHTIEAEQAGTINQIDNLAIARVARLAGAPNAKSAGIKLHAHVGAEVERGDPLFTIHTESHGELEYALHFLHEQPGVMVIGETA